jgi:hypothetical protein
MHSHTDIWTHEKKRGYKVEFHYVVLLYLHFVKTGGSLDGLFLLICNSNSNSMSLNLGRLGHFVIGYSEGMALF